MTWEWTILFRTGAAAFLPPNGSGGFLAAELRRHDEPEENGRLEAAPPRRPYIILGSRVI